jgi:AbrB family looped-hinge helix DNA binding protein
MSKKSKPGQDHVRYEVITQEDPETGDLILPIPQPVLDSLGWKEGDEVDFSTDDQGKIYIKKASK